MGRSSQPTAAPPGDGQAHQLYKIPWPTEQGRAQQKAALLLISNERLKVDLTTERLKG